MARIRYFNIRIAKTANFLLHQFWECRIVYELPRWYLADSGVQVLHMCCEYYDPGQMVSIMDANVWQSQRRWGRGCAAAGQGSQGGRDQIPQSRPSATSAATRLSPATSPIGPHTNHVCPPTSTMCGAKWQVSITQVDHQIRPNTWQPPHSRQHPLYTVLGRQRTLYEE